jgi:hypothetical protein
MIWSYGKQIAKMSGSYWKPLHENQEWKMNVLNMRSLLTVEQTRQEFDKDVIAAVAIR